MLIFIGHIFVLSTSFQGSKLASVEINSDIHTFQDATNVNLSCSFTKDTSDIVTSVEIKAKNKSTGSFDGIVAFYTQVIAKPAKHLSGGEYLSGRTSLTNPSTEDIAVLSFNRILCEDNRIYICEVFYINDGTKSEKSGESKIIVSSSPTKPENISTSVSLSDVIEWQYVSFICKGNVGNPPGKFKWTKILNDQTTMPYLDVDTTTENVLENCTSYGTSNLTIQLNATDNMSALQCEIQQRGDSESLAVKTQFINVYYDVRDVMTTKEPFMEKYKPGGSVKLTCNAKGNPVPNYRWYKDSDMNSTIANESVHWVFDLNVNKSGSYVCFAYNRVNGSTYRKSDKIDITIENANSQANYTAVADMTIIVIVAASGTSVTVFTAASVALRVKFRNKRKRVSPPKDMDQLHLSESNSESAVQISQVYSEVKDSFKRCPKTSSEVPMGVSEYAEVDPTTKTIFYKAEKPCKVDDDNIAHEYATVVKHHNIT